MDTSRIDKVLQYALVVAGAEELGERQLGPIHLLKYAYLADLAYAAVHGGETYSGSPWRFHHYGPWATEVFERIEPAMSAATAHRRTYVSARYENDAVRYDLVDEGRRRALERELPSEIQRAIRNAVHKFGADTSGLLHDVYNTPPMLHAAPGERLQFQCAVPAIDHGMSNEAPASIGSGLSKTAQRKRQERLIEARNHIEKKIEERRKTRKRIPPPFLPRYDDVFFEGVKVLQSTESADIEPSEGELEIGDGIWKSPARTESDLP